MIVDAKPHDKITRELLDRFSGELISHVTDDDYYIAEWKEHVVTKITKDDENVITGLRSTTRPVSERKINALKIIQRIDSHYKALIDHLRACYTLEHDAEVMLVYYSQRIIENGYSEADVESFLRDLNRVRPTWDNRLNLRGLVVRQTIQAGRYTFREVEQIDLAEKIYPMWQLSHRTRWPHSILEYRADQLSPQDNVRIMLNMLEVLRLYRPCAISFESYSHKTNSLNYLQLGGTPRIAIDLPFEPVLFLTETDSEPLSNFIEFMEPKTDYIKHQLKDTPFKIAYLRYMESLMNQNPSIEEKLTSAIMGLEALFLEGNRELSYKLRIQLAKLLGNLNEQPNVVLTNTRDAYSCRSKYLHGSVLKEKDQEKAKQLLNHSRNYLRKVLLYLIYHDLTSQKGKSEFIKEIENALIDDKEAIALKEKSKKVLKDFPGLF